MTDQRPSKSALRLTFLERRLQIPPEARQRAARAVFEAFFSHVQVPAGVVVSGYAPMRGELDDLPVLRELLQRGHTCALPHVAGKGLPLEFRAWTELTPMTTSPFNIAEPAAGEGLEPDILLVPLAAFDTKCHRLGYGAGFYDRTIARLRGMKPVLAIGLAYEEQGYDALPVEEYDAKLDMVITDRNIYK